MSNEIQVTFRPKSGFFFRGQPMAGLTASFPVEDAKKLKKRGELMPSEELDNAIKAHNEAIGAEQREALKEKKRQAARDAAAIKRADRAHIQARKDGAKELPPFDDYNDAVAALKEAGVEPESRKKEDVQAAYEALRAGGE